MNLYDNEMIEVDIRIWEQLKTFLPDSYDASELVELVEKRHKIKRSEESVRKEIEQLEVELF